MKNFTFKVVPGPPGAFNHLPPKPVAPVTPPPSQPVKSEPFGQPCPPPCPYYQHQPQYPPLQPPAPPAAGPMPQSPFAAARLAHAYVPWQYYRVVYPPSEALDKGTLFPELYQPQGVYGPCEGPEPCRVFGPWGGAPHGGN